MKNPSRGWFGVEDARGGRDAVLLKSLEDAVKEARERLGDDQSKWRWGGLHVARFTHPLAPNEAVIRMAISELDKGLTADSRIAEWRGLFNLPSAERGGDGNTVNSTGGPNFLQSHGASFREILDVSDWDRSVTTNAPGQSGQPGSRHYGDLPPLWAEGKYFPLLYSQQKVGAMAEERLTLEPVR